MPQILPAALRDRLLQPRIIVLLVLVNLVGTGFGFFYYLEQFAATPWPFWILVADSPIATLLIAASLFLYVNGRQNGLVDALAIATNIKYGLWTVFVLLFYVNTFAAGNMLPMYLFLLLSHLGMALQAFLVLGYARVKPIAISFTASWLLLNDFMDYWFDTHTFIYVVHDHPVSPAMIAAVILTLLAWLVLVLQWQDTE